jgi:hypothetical protein
MACKRSGVQIPSAPPQLNGPNRPRPPPSRRPRAADRQQSMLPIAIDRPAWLGAAPPQHGLTASLGGTLDRSVWAIQQAGGDRHGPLLTMDDAVDRSLGHVGGAAGEDERGSDPAARVASSCDGRGPDCVAAGLVGKRRRRRGSRDRQTPTTTGLGVGQQGVSSAMGALKPGAFGAGCGALWVGGGLLCRFGFVCPVSRFNWRGVHHLAN